MNKILLIIFVLHFNLSKAQTFTFNTFASYFNEIKALEKIRENSCFINSGNNNYFLFLYNEKGKLEANLYDIKNLKSHHYKVIEMKVNGELKFNFIFQNTKMHKTLINSNFANYQFDIKENASTEKTKKMELNVYKNVKKQRSEMNVQMEYKDMPLNLFLAYKVCCLHPFEYDENLFLNKNCLVTKGSEIALSGNIVEHRLIEYKEFILELTIPE